MYDDITSFQNTLKRSPDAVAMVAGSPAYPSIRGKVYLHQMANGILLTASINGLPQSKESCASNIYGFHIHEGTVCKGNAEDPFADAGLHFNPKNCPHPAHAGDLPPLFGNQGFAYLSFFTDRFIVSQVIGRTVIIHSHVDNFTSQPSGDSGTKIACGVIERPKRQQNCQRFSAHPPVC